MLRYSPTDFTDLHRIFLLGYSPTDFTHRSYGAFKGVHLSPLGFAACQSKKCTNTTKSTFSHRIQNTFLLGYSPTDFTDLHRTFLLRKLPQISHTEVMVLSRGCTCLKCTNTTKSIFFHRIQNRTFLLGILPQISQIYTEFFAEKTPTDFTEHTELLLRKLPQISQNTQNFLAEIFSHRFHRIHRTFLLGYSPTDFTDLHRTFLLGKIL